MCGPAVLQKGIAAATSFGAADMHLQGSCHARPHIALGGDMATHISPIDPIFFSHHAMIDYAFSMWQKCHKESEKMFLEGLGRYANRVLPGFGSNRIISSFRRKYTYADPWNIDDFATYESNPVIDAASPLLDACETSGGRKLNEEDDRKQAAEILTQIKKVNRYSVENILKDIRRAGIKVVPSVVDTKAKVQTVESLVMAKRMPGTAKAKLAALVAFECSKTPQRYIGPGGEIAVGESEFHETTLCEHREIINELHVDA